MMAAQVFQDQHSSNQVHLTRLVPSAAPLFAGPSPPFPPLPLFVVTPTAARILFVIPLLPG